MIAKKLVLLTLNISAKELILETMERINKFQKLFPQSSSSLPSLFSSYIKELSHKVPDYRAFFKELQGAYEEIRRRLAIFKEKNGKERMITDNILDYEKFKKRKFFD